MEMRACVRACEGDAVFGWGRGLREMGGETGDGDVDVNLGRDWSEDAGMRKRMRWAGERGRE